MKLKYAKFVATGALALFCSCGQAQVVINEVWANPAGGGSSNDDVHEFIELYGTPGMSLTGYAIATVFGGGDPDSDNIPGPVPQDDTGAFWDEGDELPEIDEAWSLDGLSIGSNGFLVIYNNAANSPTNPILLSLPAATTRARFTTIHIPTSDVAGRIKNDGSGTYVLVRKRPFHSVNGQTSLYDGQTGYITTSRYAWRKDVNQDVNFDGKIDYNGIGTVAGSPFPPETPVNSEEDQLYIPLPTPAPSSLEPYQMIDDIAVSNGGGKEYVRSSDQEISNTPNFNPDALSRVAYFGTNPNLGDRLNSQSQVVPTRSADEEFIYGEILVNSTRLYDAVKSGGPTFPGQTPGSRFTDISRTGFRVTPGTFNDGVTTGAQGVTVTQFRWVRGDFNFDGIVTCADRELLVARQGATIDDTTTFIDDRETPTTADDITITGWWKWQGREFNAVMAMVNFVNNGPAVSAGDLAQFDTEFPGLCVPPCPADFNGDTFVDDTDFVVFAACYEAFIADGPCAAADFNADGFVDDTDFVSFAAAYEAFVCP